MWFQENPFFERLRKMPPVIAVCAVVGAVLGAIPAALVANAMLTIRGQIAMFGLILAAGFCLGIAVGVILDTAVFKRLRDKEEKRRRRKRRREEARERKW
jgi:fructose-specific phosphotransferase system IIC component